MFSDVNHNMARGAVICPRQIANHQGYIQINWHKMKKEMKKAERELKKQASVERAEWFGDEVCDGENIIIITFCWSYSSVCLLAHYSDFG